MKAPRRRLSSRDAVAPSVRARPNMSNAGAMTPPVTMAALSHGHSDRPSTARLAAGRTAIHASSPSPLPRYRSPASSSGGNSPSNSLASGVLAPNSAAEISA
jgi:hypothetical protein